MRITAFLLLLVSLHISGLAGGQTISLSAKGTPLKTIIQQIEKQSDYSFIYGEDLLNKSNPVTVQISGASIEKALEAVFKNQPLDYKISDKYIVLSMRQSGSQKVADPEPQPFADVNGYVRGENHQPVAGVTVTEKGTKNATATNDAGQFSLKDVAKDATLVFTSTNMETEEVQLKGRTTLSVIMKTKVSPLDEMKIIAYGSTTERLRTGAVSSVKAETIERQPVGNLLLALQGQVPGLYITPSSGQPGTRVDFNIRGLNSLFGEINAGGFNAAGGLNTGGGNEPLVVIDNVPFSTTDIYVGQGYTALLSALAAINPGDIDRVDVLKDADATAIFGSQGANGVIMITTKRARAGKPTLNVSVSHGFEKLSRKLDMINTRQYLDMRYEAFANDGINWRAPNYHSAPDLKLQDTTRYTDWQKELLSGTAKFTNATVSFAGGTQQNSFNIRTNFQKHGSIFGDHFKNQVFSGTMAFAHRSNDNRMSFDLSAGYAFNDMLQPNANIYRTALSLLPHAPKLYNDDGSINWGSGSTRFNDNPVPDLLHTQEFKSHYLNINGTFSYRPAKNLTLRVQAGYNKTDGNAVNIEPKASISPYIVPAVRRGRYARDHRFNISLEPQAEYNTRLGPGKLNALLGFSLKRSGMERHIMTGEGFISDDLIRNYGSADVLNVDPFESYDYRYNAVFASLGYNIQNQYIFNLNARRDGSSRFGPRNQFGNFGSAGMAWIFSEQPAIRKAMPVFISFAKLRLSYGITGSDAIGNYGYLSTYSIPGVSAYNPPYIRLQPDRLANPDYRWATTRKADVELSLGFYKDRIITSANYYNNRSSDQLIGIPLPYTTGFNIVNGNWVATVQNTGWEFTLNIEILKSKNFTWSSNFNFTIPENKLIEYPGLETSVHNRLFVVGQPIKLRRVQDYVGINPQTGLSVYRTVSGKDTSLTTGSGTLPFSERITIDLTPKFYGGWNNNFRYKGWSFSLMFQFDRSMRVNDIAIVDIPGFPAPITQYVFNNSWRKPGDQALFPKFTARNIGPAYFSRSASHAEQYYADIWFVRLNNLTLAYALPGLLLKKLKLSSCDVSLTAQNLFTLTNSMGADPEGSMGSMPRMRILTAGVNLNF